MLKERRKAALEGGPPESTLTERNEQMSLKTGVDGTTAERREQILTQPIMSLLVRMAIPTMIGMLVMVIYNLTDTFFVGLMDDKSMTAAIGVVFSVMSIIQAIGFWFGYGSGNTMSNRLGEERVEEARAVSSLGLVFAVITGIVFTLFIEIFYAPIAGFIGGNASPELLGYTTHYLRVIGYSAPFSLFAITVYNQLRLCGNARDGMVGLLAGMLSNMVLDPILMFSFKMGFIGAAYATLAGQIIGAVVLTLLARRDGAIDLKLWTARPDRTRVYHILAGGLPNFSRQTITSLAVLLLNIIAARYGETLIAAMTVSTRAFVPAFLLMIGWCQGFQPVCAMNHGAGKHDRVRQAFRSSLLTGTIFMLVADVLMLAFAPALVGLLTSDPEVIATGAVVLRLQCISAPFLCYLGITSMYLQNIGRYFWSMLVSVSHQGIFYLPLIVLLSAVWDEKGIYLVQPVADLLSLVMTIVVMRYRGGGVMAKQPCVALEH